MLNWVKYILKYITTSIHLYKLIVFIIRCIYILGLLSYHKNANIPKCIHIIYGGNNMSVEKQHVRKQKTARKAKGNSGKAILVLFITLFLLISIGIGTYSYYILGSDTFYKGVYLDDISLEGMTTAQALKVMRDKVQPTLDSMMIRINYEGKTWEYDHNSINAAVNIEEAVEKAYEVGRTGNILNRLQEIASVGKNRKTFETALIYDTSVLKQDIQGIADELNIEPADATITFHNKKAEQFTFTPEVIGRRISVDEVMSAIKDKTDKWDFTPYELKAEVLNPKYTLDEVKTWTNKLTTFETVLTASPERNHNITLSSSSFDGIRIDPGQEFSLNETTGPRGIKEGYKNAPVIVNGIKLDDEPGGGNCQTSTTLYGALVRVDLEIIERWNHSWPSGYIDVGKDAMVDYPSADLKVKNNKDSAIFISRSIIDNKLIVEVYGKKSDEFDNIDIVSEVLSTSETPAMIIVNDPNLFVDQSVVEYKSRPLIKAQSYRVYYKDGKEVKRVKEASSSYRKIVGKKLVGTKPRPVVTPTPVVEDPIPAETGGL